MSERVNPSKLHLKKELTQIRKTARTLRDPGTDSYWQSPLPLPTPSGSPQTAAAAAATVASPSHSFSSSATPAGRHNAAAAASGNGVTAREKKVFLVNWRNSYSYKSSRSQKSLACLRGVRDDADELSSVLASVDVEGDSLSDYYVGGDRDRSLTRLDSDISGRSDAKQKQKQKQRIIRRKSAYAKRPAPMSRDDTASLADCSDETEDYDTYSRDLFSIQRQHKLRITRKLDSPYAYNSTPTLSASSYNNPYDNTRNPSTAGSWDGTVSASRDDWDDEHLDLPGRRLRHRRHGCGISCSWPKNSPSFSDALRRKGKHMLCVRRRRDGHGRNIAAKTAQGVLPLLKNGSGESSIGSGGDGDGDDDLSTNFEEIDLEASSRLDGRRWSVSCRRQEALTAAAEEGEEEGGILENGMSLSQKYRPMFFEELIGQNITVQSLTNAVSRGRIGPVYLFQGPTGTGKTSAARLFGAALNCMAPAKETKPCGICRECADFFSGRSRDLREIDGPNMEALDSARFLKKLLTGAPPVFPKYKVFVVDECHLIPPKTWMTLLKFLEQPLPRVVFILITTEADDIPPTVLSRCQKHFFNKVKESDIVARLKKISDEENLEVESDALDLISLNADGSLRDAECMLDQLSLLGKRITTSLVNELVGVVSDGKLLELLEIALSLDTGETVRRARELLDAGIDPMVLISQMASIIVDLIAGTYHPTDTNYTDSDFVGRSLTDSELERLKHALKLLSEAEKQLRVSSERSTWFTATLLQLGSISSSDFTQSSSSRRQSFKATEEDQLTASKKLVTQKRNSNGQCMPQNSVSSSLSIPSNGDNGTQQGDSLSLDSFNFHPKSKYSQLLDASTSAVSRDNFLFGNAIFNDRNSDQLDYIWRQCIAQCHSKTLRQLLQAHGKLLLISEVEGTLIASIAFQDGDIKIRAEQFRSSITDSIETVLRCNVDVRIILLQDGEVPMNSIQLTESNYRVGKAVCRNSVTSEKNPRQEPIKLPDRSLNDSENTPKAGPQDHSSCSSSLVGRAYHSATVSQGLAVGATEICDMKERRQEIPEQRIEYILHEQKLETAWLQTAEKVSPASLSRLKLERNRVLPQDGMYRQSQMATMNSVDQSSGHGGKELNHEIRVTTSNDGTALRKDQDTDRVEQSPVPPNSSKDNLRDPESRSSCCCGRLFGCFCRCLCGMFRKRRERTVRDRQSTIDGISD